MMESTLMNPSETVPITTSIHTEQSFSIGNVIVYSSGSKKLFLIVAGSDTDSMIQRSSQQNDLLQSEMSMLYELPHVLKVKQTVAEEKEYFENTYDGEVLSSAETILNHVAEKVAEISFKELTVELTLLNTAIFHLRLKDSITLLITVPLIKHEDLNRIEVIYNLFLEDEEVVSSSKDLNEVLEGAKQLIGQRIGFTTA